MELFASPSLTPRDDEVLARIHESRDHLGDVLRVPRRWFGGLRRTTIARAIQGSNSIEGYDVDDAVAAVDSEEPMTADEVTWAEIESYRRALNYVLQAAQDEYFEFNPSVLRGMHFMMLGHDLSKSPGRYRPGQIFVNDEQTGTVVYEGPDFVSVPPLISALTTQLSDDNQLDSYCAWRNRKPRILQHRRVAREKYSGLLQRVRPDGPRPLESRE